MPHPNPEPPAAEQAVARLTKILDDHYDFEGDPSTPIQDLLTDLLHVFDYYAASTTEPYDLDMDLLLERAGEMRDDENREPLL